MNNINVKNKTVKLFSKGEHNLGLVLALLAIVIFFQIITGGILLKPANVAYIILQNSYIMVLVFGMLLCILTGNVDLSVGSVAGFVSAVSGILMVERGMNPFLVVIICLGIGFIIGI